MGVLTKQSDVLAQILECLSGTEGEKEADAGIRAAAAETVYFLVLPPFIPPPLPVVGIPNTKPPPLQISFPRKGDGKKTSPLRRIRGAGTDHSLDLSHLYRTRTVYVCLPHRLWRDTCQLCERAGPCFHSHISIWTFIPHMVLD